MKILGWLEKVFVVTTIATLLLAAARSLPAPLSVDEGYNLEVVANLTRGVGYASYGNHRLDATWSALPLLEALVRAPDGRLGPLQPWFFDPRVTTGPAVLLPLAVVSRAFPGAILPLRLFLWLFVPLFLAALWWATPPGSRRISLVALAASICCSLWFGFKAGAILGDFPSAVFFTLGAVALVRKRPFLAGLFFAFSVLSKVIMLFAVLAAIALFAVELVRAATRNLRRVLWLLAGFLVPLAAFEVFRLLTLGSLEAYCTSWQEFMAFSGQQTGAPLKTVFLAKWHSVKSTGPGLWFLAVAFVASILSFLQRRRAGDTYQSQASIVLTHKVGAFMLWGAVPVALFWLLGSAQTSYRQVLPAAVLLFSGVILFSYHPAEPHLESRRARNVVLAGDMLLWLLGLLAVGNWAAVFFRSGELSHRYALQLEAAQLLKHSNARGISPLVRWTEPFPFLSDLRVQPCPAPGQALVVTAWAQVVEKKNRDAFLEDCQKTITQTPDVLICWPKDSLSVPWSLAELQIADWGPRELHVGQVPNPQPGGGGALWFRLTQPVRSPQTLALLVNDKVAGLVAWSAKRDWLSAPFHQAFFQQPQTLQLTLFNPCNGEKKSLGMLQVKP